ncbi:MAG: NADP-dependent isocitrate dehydrogenase [Bacteroidales bacterium]
MKDKKSTIVYTGIDEAPALATYSLLPIISSFTKIAGINVELRDISLSGRIIANFPEQLKEDQKISDELSYLGELVKKPEANIIKLPNISASVPQLMAAIKELQSKGYNIPDYPENPQNEKEKEIQNRYAKVLGSAVNPVIREGNSDRRVARAVKEYAKKHPSKLGAWDKNAKTHVSHMDEGDFYANEKSVCVDKAQNVRIELVNSSGRVTVLREKLSLQKEEILDATFLNVKMLNKFVENELIDARQKDLLFSVHLKATMMKISDPVIFGHFVAIYYKDVFEKYAAEFTSLGVNPNLGLGDLFSKLEKLQPAKREEIKNAIDEVYTRRPKLAMVDSEKGITNLHAGNDIIIDASMPVVIRDSGKMWGPDGKLHETKAVIPDRCYATFYQVVIDFCRENGAFDPSKMGNVSNVGLMAQKAEEYGSHDKTFIVSEDGIVRVVDENGIVVLEHKVSKGDIWRACQTKDLPVKDWVKLAVQRARATNSPAIFWLDKNRAHDNRLIKKVNLYLKDHDTNGLEIKIMAPVDAVYYTLKRVKEGKDTISVTGNVLRDYLTDLFPILELGTSAKMLSIVPLLEGGGLYETGAGGSAPKHVQQFEKEGHLRWDSLGEFLALAVSIEDLGIKTGNHKAKLLASTLDKAIGRFLENEKSPSRKVNEIDTRGSHFYLAMYWSHELAEQNEDLEIKNYFRGISENLATNENKIVEELLAAQGKPVNLGGYYKPDLNLANKAMRPSSTFNSIIDSMG